MDLYNNSLTHRWSQWVRETFAFFDPSRIELVERFERLPQKNKVIFSEKDYPDAPHVFYIHGFPKGLNVLSLFHGLCGHRKMDQFDFVHWFNTGEFKRNY